VGNIFGMLRIVKSLFLSTRVGLGLYTGVQVINPFLLFLCMCTGDGVSVGGVSVGGALANFSVCRGHQD